MSATRAVVDDRSIAVRAVLRKVLEESGDISVIGEADDGREIVDLTDRHHPDVVEHFASTESAIRSTATDPQLTVCFAACSSIGRNGSRRCCFRGWDPTAPKPWPSCGE